MQRFKLCGEGKCCPEVEITDDKMVVIKDDDGGQVKISVEQVEILFEKMNLKSKAV